MSPKLQVRYTRFVCGRYTMSDPERVYAEFSVLEKEPALEPRFNIAPGQGVWVIRVLTPGGGRRQDLLHWGLPAASARAKGAVMARSESLESKPMFARSFRARRCLMLADGFYEWRRAGKTSFPYFIHRIDRAPFAMAAIWQPAAGASELDACAVITGPAAPPVSAVHDRMPIILAAQHHQAWLDPGFHDVPMLKSMLTDGPGFELIARPVSSRVNSPANDDPSCTEVIAPDEQRGEQFELWPRAGQTRAG